MKCVVPGANIKILAKAIHSLAKIGDEMYVEPQDVGISFRTVNMARSAYASFTFAESFFSYYTYGNLEEDDALRCQITMRAPSMLDKQVDTCQINLEAKSCKLLFVLKYKNGITKTHFLPIIDCHVLQAVFSQQPAPSQLTAHHKVMSDAMLNFQQLGLFEITLEVTSHKVLLRNYVDDTSDLSKVTRTQLALGVGEFDEYKIGADTAITFCVKEFKSVLNFAEAVSSPVSIHFETAGKPIIFIIKSSTFESNIVLSTLNPDADSQSDVSTVHARERTLLKKATGNKRRARKTIETSKRKETNESHKLGTSKSKTMSKPMEITNTELNNSRINPPEEPMHIDPSEDCLLAAIGDNVPTKTDRVYRKTFFSKTSENVRTSTPTSMQNQNKGPVNSNSISSSKKSAKSIFSTITNKTNSETTLSSIHVNEDIVPNSPPRHVSKKARFIFNKCFQATFDPRMLPGHDVVLAEDTDDSD